MGKSTISMAIFNSYVKLPEGIISYVIYHVISRHIPHKPNSCTKLLARQLKQASRSACFTIFSWWIYSGFSTHRKGKPPISLEDFPVKTSTSPFTEDFPCFSFSRHCFGWRNPHPAAWIQRSYAAAKKQERVPRVGWAAGMPQIAMDLSWNHG